MKGKLNIGMIGRSLKAEVYSLIEINSAWTKFQYSSLL